MAYEKYYEYYEKQGLAFSRSVLTTYCLSLFTKPFVILSGISGTGKTKIAQLFGTPATAALPAKPALKAADPAGKWILMNVTEGVTVGDGRTNFKYGDLDALYTEAEIKALEPRIASLIAAGRQDNITDTFRFTIEALDGTILNAEAYLQRAKSPLLRVRFKSKRGDADPYDSTSYFAKHYKVGTILKLEKVGDKRLKIVTENDHASVLKAEELEKDELNFVKNTCVIAVRSDWSDASPLFGYYNLVDQRYHLTPLLTFILTAKENPTLPFFLVLDEMNLAKVEHYFSDFLSCLESRHVDNGVLVQEPIHIHSQSGHLETDNDYFDLIAPTLELPTNLFVTGTVNVDETTYMFSPKVLDRANVIEFNDVDIDGFHSAIVPGAAASSFSLSKFPSFLDFKLPQRKDFQALPTEALSVIVVVHGILKRHNLQFGYRVINEVSRFILNAVEFCEPSPTLLQEALDAQLMQKVLPKFNGSQGKLELPIREILQFLVNGDDKTPIDLDALEKLDISSTKFPLTIGKLRRMTHALAINGFANFIE